ncbi:hypothetical protein [Clostridium sp. Marseille-P299]|uniref:hypothetical protein n=1 Tax=Clostridium sp. Marseille-P299 TaxID=1805477 RepID=UPI00083262D3|nr:hypothetical protein [Clostridium sp. Marseille-P299]
MKRVFGIFEAVFDALYLIAALILGFILISSKLDNDARILAGIMAIVLACGDAFHLLPRILLIITHKEERLRRSLGIGKQITSITMTVFYLFMWQIGLMIFSPNVGNLWTYLVYFLAAVRILLCLLPQNRWQDRYPPVSWGIWRNIPFFLQGAVVALLFFLQRNITQGFGFMWLAIVLSFGFYLPVVLWSNRNPKIGMLMLPKTCCYLWMLAMCLSL